MEVHDQGRTDLADGGGPEAEDELQAVHECDGVSELKEPAVDNLLWSETYQKPPGGTYNCGAGDAQNGKSELETGFFDRKVGIVPHIGVWVEVHLSCFAPIHPVEIRARGEGGYHCAGAPGEKEISYLLAGISVSAVHETWDGGHERVYATVALAYDQQNHKRFRISENDP